MKSFRYLRAAGAGKFFRRAPGASIGAFARRLRSHSYDKIIDTQGLLRTGIMTKIARGERNGYDVASVREKMAARFYDVHYNVPRDLHAVRRNRLLTGLALGYDVKGPPDYGLDRGGLAIVSSKPYAILLHATAERRKEWSEESWIALARALEQHVDVLLPWGSDAEHERAERIASQLKRTVVPIRRELDDMARMIAGASLVVGVDTGLLHLAAALAVPLVGVFVGSEPGLTGPTGAGPIVTLGGKAAPPAAAEVLAALVTGDVTGPFHRHCEPKRAATDVIARSRRRQSNPVLFLGEESTGLLRRCAPRNDEKGAHARQLFPNSFCSTTSQIACAAVM